MNKKDLREKIQLKLKDLHSREEKNKLIFEELINNKDIKNSKNIMCFVSFKNEVDTHKFIKYMLKNNKNIYIPIIDSKNKIMNISKLKSFDELEKGFYGILEPKKEFIRITNPNILDIVITPGIVFAKDNYRIGYGGGFYDKFFANKKLKAKKIGLCFSEQIIESIPIDKYDIPVDYIIHK
ncbi:5-formyltetrahydrofolate cyclo-ligase [Anaerofustis butyriciformans]|uniref:5-formyltetrahydrofolate cyclo-ligase n=1 Tax=Anaerofustis butyriciformans TaxID=3108533 RepID=UPI002E366A8A|nr:5-formyltetrahydrofolate cyclo-ligase [Anaerofustis sp. HA2171]